MTQPFEDLPTTPRAQELLDKAFSRAARAGRAKSGREAQESMLRTAAHIVSDNLENVVVTWPDFDGLDPFYYEIADAVASVDDLRQHLASVDWASRQADQLLEEYANRLRTADTETARKLRKQAFARLADVVEQTAEDLAAVGEAREALRRLPDIRPGEPAIVIAGYPNVGKSSFVNAVTDASIEVADYPFTTTQVAVGHVERRYVRYQIVDTPGLLDRPADERNEVESRATSAIAHLADCVLVFVDPSGTGGYPLDDQLSLRDELAHQFDDVPVLTVYSKADRSRDLPAEHAVSVETGEGVEAVLEAAVDAVDYDPEVPVDDGPEVALDE